MGFFSNFRQILDTGGGEGGYPSLAEIQMQSLGIQGEAMTEVMNLARQQQQQNAELMPLQKQQMELGVKGQQQAYDQSQSDRAWLLGRRDSLTTLQDGAVAEAANFNSEATQNQRAQAAQADVGKAFSDMDTANARQMASMGVTPGSGRFSGRSDADRARVSVGAANNARLGARNEGRALTDRASSMLASYPAMASNTTSQGASLAAGGLGVVNQAAGGMTAGNSAATGLYGGASSIGGQVGAGATNQMNVQAMNNAAEKAASTDWMNDVGSLAGAGLGIYKAWQTSDRRLKVNIEAVGQDARTGLTLYEFAYSDYPDERWRGVMADEVLLVMPEAVETGESGYMTVDYGALGIEMVRVS